jgi:hypothetical protein
VGEPKDTFIRRCMADPNAKREFPDRSRRYQVCEYRWAKYPPKGGSIKPSQQEAPVKLLWNPPVCDSSLIGGQDERTDTDG